jgi:hypothetical protein
MYMSEAKVVSAWLDLQEIAKIENVQLIVVDNASLSDPLFRIRMDDGLGCINCYESLEAVAAFFEGLSTGQGKG